MSSESMTAAELFRLALMALGLSACCGLRAFLPLLAYSGLALAGIVELPPMLTWLGSWPALIVLGLATVFEVILDKQVGLDHVLDGLGLVLRPMAGAIVAAAAGALYDPTLGLVVGALLGGSLAGGVHLGKAKLRLASSAITAGLANLVLSLLEDAFVLLSVVLAILFPLAVLVLFALLGLGAWRLTHLPRQAWREGPGT